MAQTRNYATKKKGKTEVYPFWNLVDIKNMVDWFENNNEWDGYLITILELLLGRRISDTVSMRWSDLYYENGNKREDVTTIVEKKTGKTTELPIGSLVFEAVDKYCAHTRVDPIGQYEEYIFNCKCKTNWISRSGNKIYKENNLDKICEILEKDFSDERKADIMKCFSKQSEYKTLGDYFYYEVEWSDVVKWQSDSYRKTFNKAVKACGIDYRVSTHSFRKSFGYWIYKLHPFDPDVLISLQKLFAHATLQQTEDYIGLTKEKNKKFIQNYNDLLKDVLEGDVKEVAKNMPVISLKSDDLMVIFRMLTDDIDKYQSAINMANEMRVV